MRSSGRTLGKVLVLTTPLAFAMAACGTGGSSSDAPSGVVGGAGATGGMAAGGSGHGGSSSGGTSATGGGNGSCALDADCPTLPTTPPGCAVAHCEAVTKKCTYAPRDADGDHSPDAQCKPVGATVFQVGDDCDDNDPATHPGAWDGPMGDGHPDSCDRKDQDCNGTNDDGALANGTSCECQSGESRECSQDSAGHDIAWPKLDSKGEPVGVCKKGKQLCEIHSGHGTWGDCKGAIVPSPTGETCNGLDDNCNGVVDDGATDAKAWAYDGDGDFHGAVGESTVQSCDQPTVPPADCPMCDPKGWKQVSTLVGVADDCNDKDPSVHAAAPEVCDGKDNDCNGMTDEGCSGCKVGDPCGSDSMCNKGTFTACTPGTSGTCSGGPAETKAKYCPDGDGDGYCALAMCADFCPNAPPAAPMKPISACTSPTTPDCNDGDSTINPGAVEVCDGVRNDCDTTKKPDEGATSIATWYRDDDGDGHLLDKTLGAAQKKVQCEKPGSTAADCPTGMTTCTNLWVKEGQDPFDDCDDTNGDRFPGNWDGPATTQQGIAEPGWSVDLFARNAGNVMNPPGSSETPTDSLTAPVLSYNWSYAKPTGGLPNDYWCLRASGSLQVQTAGSYTFHVTADDGARLWIDGATQVIDHWTPGGAVEVTGSLTLSPGLHSIRVEYFENTGLASLLVEWDGPGFAKTALRVHDPAALGTKPDKCDMVDQNCIGGPDELTSQAPGSIRSCQMECEPGSERPCGGNSNTGACREGTQTCTSTGAWPAVSVCDNEIVPAGEVCNGIDDNCNGPVDEGTGGGDTCNTGLPGNCAGGVHACVGGMIVCQQLNNKGSRNCWSGGDYDCDGQADNTTDGYCVCQPGQMQACGGHAQDGVGICHAGTQSCVQNGQTLQSGWGACTNSVPPQAEQCQTDVDYNCDGVIGNAGTCIHVVWMLSAWSHTCSKPDEAVASLSSSEGSYGYYALVRAWDAPGPSGVAINRCICWNLGFTTAHIATTGVPCPTDAGGVACELAGTMGYLSTKNQGSLTNQVQRISTTSGAESYCSDSGCTIWDATGGCLAKTGVGFYSPAY